jgi:hypothetical protein
MNFKRRIEKLEAAADLEKQDRACPLCKPPEETRMDFADYVANPPVEVPCPGCGRFPDDEIIVVVHTREEAKAALEMKKHDH